MKLIDADELLTHIVYSDDGRQYIQAKYVRDATEYPYPFQQTENPNSADYIKSLEKCVYSLKKSIIDMTLTLTDFESEVKQCVAIHTTENQDQE